MRTEFGPGASSLRNLLLSGAIACGLALLLVAWQPKAALGGWLVAYVFTSAIPIGSLGLLMMMRLIPGAWGGELAPLAEGAVLLSAVAMVAALPMLLGLSVLYPWTAGVEPHGMRPIYLTSWFFVLRTALFWASVVVLAMLLLARQSWSTPVAAAGLILFVLLDTTVAVDWLMSLEPDFHSSGFGLYVLSIQMTVALCALTVGRLLAGPPPERTGILGGLLLTALLLWTYLTFMQYFIIWSGNLPQGVRWYEARATSGWILVAQLVGLSQLLPTFLLLFPPVRHSPIWLLALCFLVLIGKALEISWLVLPATASGSLLAPLAAFLALIGLGLLFLAGARVARPLTRRLAGSRAQPGEAAS
jgi:hypothetical protein